MSNFNSVANCFSNINASQIDPATTTAATFGGALPLIFPNGLTITPGEPGSPEATQGQFLATDYLACMGGTSDQTSLQIAASAAALGGGGTIFLNAKACNFSGALTLTGNVSVKGLGSNATVIFQTCTTCDTIHIGNAVNPATAANSDTGTTFSDFGISCQVTQTAGTGVQVSFGSLIEIKNIAVNGCYNGFGMGQTAINDFVNNIEVHNVTTSVTHDALRYAGVEGGIYVHDSELNCNGNTGSSVGIFFDGDSGSGLTIDPTYVSNVDIENCAGGVVAQLDGSFPQSITDSFFTNIISDGPGVNGVIFATANNAQATITRLKFVNLWSTTSGTSVPALQLSALAGGVVNDVQVTAGNFSGSGTGIIVSGASSVDIDHVQIYGSGGAGFDITGSKDSIRDSQIGNVYGTGGNLAQCGFIRSASSYVTLTNDDCRGNGTSSQPLQIASGAQHILVRGVDLRGYSSAAFPPIMIQSSNMLTDDIDVNGNPGENPIGLVTAPTIPATGTFIPNPYPATCMVYVTAAASTQTGLYVRGLNNLSGSTTVVIPAGATLPVLVAPLDSIAFSAGTPQAWVWNCI